MLELSKIRKTLPFEIKKGSYGYSISEYATNKYDIEIDFNVYLFSKDKNLQRDFCWTLEQKQTLIISVLKGIKLPLISIIIYEHSIHKIIDGKQRLSTLISFYNNKFPIIWDAKEYFFKDLENRAQYEIANFSFIQDLVYEYKDKMLSDDNKIAWFEMINFAGTPQDIEHLNRLKQ